MSDVASEIIIKTCSERVPHNLIKIRKYSFILILHKQISGLKSFPFLLFPYFFLLSLNTIHK
jgi:hypothetical protein